MLRYGGVQNIGLAAEVCLEPLFVCCFRVCFLQMVSTLHNGPLLSLPHSQQLDYGFSQPIWLLGYRCPPSLGMARHCRSLTDAAISWRTPGVPRGAGRLANLKRNKLANLQNDMQRVTPTPESHLIVSQDVQCAI